MSRPPSFEWNQKSALPKLDSFLKKLSQGRSFEKLKKEMAGAKKAPRRKK
jgi:hypothetical protein